MKIDNRVVLVTGASGGIGRLTATALARRGARLILAGRNGGVLDTVAECTGGRSVVADLERPDGVEKLLIEATDVDIAVLNAGVGWYGETASMPMRDLDRLVAVNMIAPLRLSRELLPRMLERGQGHIVFVASVAGHFCVERETVYSATKAAVVAFAEALRAELSGSGVGVSLVSPGAVQTEFFRRRGSPYQRDWPSAVRPARVASAVVRAIEHDRPEVFVPAWMRLPASLRGGWPGLYRRLAAHFG